MSATTAHFNPRTPCGVRPALYRNARLATYFNPRTPCEVRPKREIHRRCTNAISTHTPLAGCDMSEIIYPAVFHAFQPTHPSRGATRSVIPRAPSVMSFQTHAPLAGCDLVVTKCWCSAALFQPMHPSRGATNDLVGLQHAVLISIHASLAGCDAI